MKFIKITIITLSFLPIYLQGQNLTGLEDCIKNGLMLYVEKNKEYLDKSIIREDYFNNLYFSTDNFPPHFSFEDTILNTPINYISLNNYSKYTKKLKKGIYVVSLNKINLDKNKLTISFIEQSVKLRNSNLTLSLGGSLTLEYEYCCDKERWVLIEQRIT